MPPWLNYYPLVVGISRLAASIIYRFAIKSTETVAQRVFRDYIFPHIFVGFCGYLYGLFYNNPRVGLYSAALSLVCELFTDAFLGKLEEKMGT